MSRWIWIAILFATAVCMPSAAAVGADDENMQMPSSTTMDSGDQSTQTPYATPDGSDMSGAGPKAQGKMMDMSAMCSMMGSIAADGSSLYMVRGGQLMKLDKTTMQVTASKPLQTSASATAMQPTPGSTGAGKGMMGMDCSMPAVAVDDTSIYVLRGSDIARYDKSTLQFVSSCALPAMPSTAPPAPAGSGPSYQPTPEPLVGSTSSGVPVTLGSLSPGARDTYNRLSTMQPAGAEQMYMQTIIRSHDGAIAWSRLAETKATRSQLKSFAKSLIKDESGVNSKFSTWTRQWYNVSPSTTMTDSDTQVLNNLKTLSGRDFDIAYMRALITHFSDAVALSQAVQKKATHVELRNMASGMSEMHSSQIQQMRTWLLDWYGVNG